MSLERCTECQTLMSDKAGWCLNCGYPIVDENEIAPNPVSTTSSSEKRSDFILLAILASLLVLIVLNFAQYGS